MSAAEKHNQLARDFVMKVAGQTRTETEMMVVLESSILAAMLILTARHGLKPAGAVEMVEMAVQQATDRFAQNQGRL